MIITTISDYENTQEYSSCTQLVQLRRNFPNLEIIQIVFHPQVVRRREQLLQF